MSHHIAYHVMLRALHGEAVINLKNDRLIKLVSNLLK